MAEAFAEGGGVADGPDALRIQFGAGEGGGGEGDAQLAGIAADLLGEGSFRRRQEVGIAHLGLADDIQQGGAVAHRAGERMLHRGAGPPFSCRGEGDPAPGGLQAEQATGRGRHANGAAAVAGVRARHDAGRHSR